MHQSFRHADVEQQRVDAGEVEQEAAGRSLPSLSGSNITLSRNRSAWMAARGRPRWRPRRRVAAGRRVRRPAASPAPASTTGPDHRHRLGPPARPRRLGWHEREVLRGRCMRASIQPTIAQCRRRVGREAGGSRAAARPPPPACRAGVQQLAAAIGMRPRHRDAALGEVLHQPQVEGQLRVRPGARTASARSGPSRCRRSSWCSRCRWRWAAAPSGRRCRAARRARPPRRTRERERDLGVDRHAPVSFSKLQHVPDARLLAAPREVLTPSPRSREPSPVMIS